MTSFAFQVGDPHEDPDSELKVTDFFDPDTVGIGAIPESNDDTTVTAMLEALDSNMSKAHSVLAQIKSSGKVSRSMMLETIDFYEELDTVPIKFYTEAPTAQLGEPTVESLGKWLSKAGDTIITLIEKVWKFLARYIKLAWQTGMNFLRSNSEKDNVKKMNSIVWPNSLTDAQGQYLTSWALSRNHGTFFSAFWNMSKSKDEKSLQLKYIKDFTTSGGVFTTELNNFVSSSSIGMIVGAMGDTNRIQDLFSSEADQQFELVSKAMDKLKASIDNAPEMTTNDYKGMSDDPNAILAFIKDYIRLRTESVKSGKGTTGTIEATQQLLRKLDKFDNNVNRIKDRLGDVINQERGSDDETRISQRVNQIRELILFVTQLQTYSVDFAKNLLDYDQIILKVPTMLEKVEKDTDSAQPQQNFREGMKDTFAAAYSALSLSIEDANIINYSARNTPEMNAEKGSGSVSITQRIKDWFARAIDWVRKAIRAANDFYQRLTTNVVERMVRFIMRISSSGFKSTWKEFKASRIPPALFEEVLPQALDKAHESTLKTSPQNAVFVYDLTFGNMELASSIMKTKVELPAMTRTLNKLGDMFRALERDSSPEAVIRYLHEHDPGKDTNSFNVVKSVIEQSFTSVNEKIEQRLGKTGQASIVPSEPSTFVSQGDLLAANFDKGRSTVKEMHGYVRELQYLWTRNKVNDLLERFQELMVNEQKEALAKGETSPERIEALRKTMEFLTTYLETARYVISLIDGYILTVYMMYMTYDNVTNAVLKSVKARQKGAFSGESLDAMAGSFVDVGDMATLPVDSELAIETYMDQGEDSYEQQMSDSGGQQQASYLTQAADAQMEDAEQKQEDDPYKEATEQENDNPDIAEDNSEAITDPVLKEVAVQTTDGAQDINDALGRLDDACELVSKIQDSEGVTRELAMEGYEHFPLAMGNPTNYIKGKVYVADRQAALESLSSTIKDAAVSAYEWIVKVAKIVAEKIDVIYQRVRRFTAQYNEGGVVKRIASVKREAMAPASAFESDELLAQLKKMCEGSVKDSKFVSQVLLTNPGSLSEFDLNFDKIIRQSTGIRDVLKMATENRDIQGPVRKFDIPGLARLINEISFAGRRVDVTDELMAKSLDRYRSARPVGSFANVIGRYESHLSALNKILADINTANQRLQSAKFDSTTGTYRPEGSGRAPEAFGADEADVIKSVARTLNLLSSVAGQLDMCIRSVMAFDRATLHSVKKAHQGESAGEPAQTAAA